MNQADVIIVGGGTAGCVLASQLTEDPHLKVLLVEAGPGDNNIFINMPKGMTQLLSNPRYTYQYLTDSNEGRPEVPPEVQLRGKVLGGSSAVNGMVYHRGQPQDYDRWAELGLDEWSWEKILPCFVKLENHCLPATSWRGRGGPVEINMPKPDNDEFAEAMFSAAGALGLPRKEEPNLPDQLGISYTACNITRSGRRHGAARAFLPATVRRRSNLKIVTDTRVDRVTFDGKRATGVLCTRGSETVAYSATREVILCGGIFGSTQLLQLSGIGDPCLLREYDIPVVHDLPGVGRNYRDHLCLFSQWQLKHDYMSENRDYQGWRVVKSALRYALGLGGPLATGSHYLAMFADLLSGDGRPDAEFLCGFYALESKADKGTKMTGFPGCHFFAYPLRGTSQGTVKIQSSDPAAPPRISPNYLDTEHDRQLVIAIARYIRELMATPALAPYVIAELPPSRDATSDAQVLELVRLSASSAFHACGTCKMGTDDDPGAVLDQRTRVRGVENLRVVDCSIFPEQVSANTNGPVMAVALRASELIRQDLAN